MIVKGSLRYTSSGRKRKEFKPAKTTNKNREFKPLDRAVVPSREYMLWQKTHREKYPSLSFKPGSLYVKRKPEENFREEVSKQYTVSIPYNKGAYQVIPEDEVEGIGRQEMYIMLTETQYQRLKRLVIGIYAILFVSFVLFITLEFLK